MDFHDIVKMINKFVDDNDLISARSFIETNIDLLVENKHLLRSNARELVDFVNSNSTSDFQPLNREEMNVIYSVNAYASNFDMRGLKVSVQNNLNLLKREDVLNYLNDDAKALVENMKVFS